MAPLSSDGVAADSLNEYATVSYTYKPTLRRGVGLGRTLAGIEGLGGGPFQWCPRAPSGGALLSS
ncbi:hypothetical protein GCM10007053_10170 [Halioglobus pacificus]|uniref:Uncharacterized protein n=1 Tax=Parahalioglobus pacificus TaxID=930806 RepID=A0A918XF03_9GAMM|nr:hypothetical protein GCM10007053_10170 [Halioglobus pacificus]